MSRMDPGLRNLIAEAIRLLTETLKERVEDGELLEKLADVNRRMGEDFGRFIDIIEMNFSVITVPVAGEESKRGGKAPLKLSFGDSEEDQEMKKKFGLDEEEMNRLLEQARREGGDERGDNNAVLADAEEMPRPPAEMKEAAESADPRGVSQIINDIRTVARGLNPNSREAFSRHIKRNDFFRRKGIIFPEEAVLKNDTLWLNGIQELINFIQKKITTPGLRRETLLVLEKAIQLAGTGKL